ncbi:hypothetical protein RMR26_12505 [Enterobacter cloacae]|uniref:hypothetical protein n=1 Tax=Enterobacter cloacae TaxID=550 RepID=UPI002885B6F8|nr:hypothetical protein [Enterobacter cloacae]MDT0535833.1 hypothetical protein [Enterobacter cloacae]
MSNIDKRAKKELYAKVERQAHSLRGNSLEYQALTGLCPVNVIEMHAQKIQALLDELEPMALAHLNLNLLCDVYRSAYEEARHDGLVNWEAAASLAEENEDLKRKLEAKDRRIAELEMSTMALRG